MCGKEYRGMMFRPLHDKVIVQRLEKQETTAGGIIIPDTAREKPQEGRVIAVGSGTMLESGKTVPPQVKAGDRVLFGKYAGNEIKLADDARAVRLRNTGNAPALRVHTSVVPINFDFDVASIAVDAVHEQPLPAQVSEVKAVVSFENARGEPFKRSQLLSALHADSDPLRPTFPIFGWR